MFYSKLLDFPDQGVPLDSGIWPGMVNVGCPLWFDGQNVRFNNGSVQKDKGYSQAFTSGVAIPVKGLGQQLVSAGQRIFFGTRSNLYRWDTASVASMASGFTGADDATATQPATYWLLVPWGTWMLATNGKDVVQVYKGSSFAALTGVTFTYARILLKWGPYVLAFNTSNGIDKVEWCDTDNVESWTPGASSAAGNYTFRDIESEIMAACLLGKNIAVFMLNSMQIGQYTGPPYQFGFAPALEGIGAVSTRAVVSVGRQVFGLGPLGFWVTDGSSYQYIDEPAVRKWFFERVNLAQITKVCAFHDEDASAIKWFYPTTSGENDAGIFYDYKRKVWGIIGYGRSACLKKEVFAYPILGAGDGKVHYGNFGVNADGGALTAYVQSKPFSVSDAAIWKWIDHLIVEAEVTGTVEISVGFQDTLNGTITWLDKTLAADAVPIFIEKSARWVSVRIRSTAVGADWEVSKLHLNGQPLGGPV